MGMTSAAEAKLDARIRPEIAVLRARTPYPGRSRRRRERQPALEVLPGGAGTVRIVRPASDDAAGREPAPDAGAAGGSGPAPQQAAGRAACPASQVRHVRHVRQVRQVRLTGPARRQAGAPIAPLRLTRRGKAVAGLLVAIAVAGLTTLIWLAIAGQAQAAGPA